MAEIGSTTLGFHRKESQTRKARSKGAITTSISKYVLLNHPKTSRRFIVFLERKNVFKHSSLSPFFPPPSLPNQFTEAKITSLVFLTPHNNSSTQIIETSLKKCSLSINFIVFSVFLRKPT